MSIAHTNKDIISKTLAQHYKDKSFSVYGLDVPKIKQVLPTDYPLIAVEYRGDGAFLLQDNSLFLQEYESTLSSKNFLKYLQYVLALIKILADEGIKVTNVIIAVIYTGDVLTARDTYDLGAVRITVQQVFLSNFDTDGMYTDFQAKVEQRQRLADEDVMRLIIWPLTQPGNDKKQDLIKKAIYLVEQIEDEEQQKFIIAGILTATDKFISRADAEALERILTMTKVGRLFEERAIAFGEQRWQEGQQEGQLAEAKRTVLAMLKGGKETDEIMQYSELSRQEIEDLQKSLALPV
ncbi:MAG: hypothetical protein FWG65_06415 [Turicibacter sp.]|nr:hypothetical protein [Turicibacter sp.]